MATAETQSDDHMSDSDPSIFSSEPLGTETLDARSMVPAEFQSPPPRDADVTHTPVWVNGRQFLKVDHTANVRMGSPVSKIWQYGTEYRLAGNLERRYWRCDHCRQPAMFNVLHSHLRDHFYSFPLPRSPFLLPTNQVIGFGLLSPWA
jgi:hypothetical protein